MDSRLRYQSIDSEGQFDHTYFIQINPDATGSKRNHIVICSKQNSDNTIPMYLHNGFAYRVNMQENADADQVDMYLTSDEFNVLLSNIIGGYYTDYNLQGNIVGHLSDTGIESLETIRTAVESMTTDPAEVRLTTIEEWFHATSDEISATMKTMTEKEKLTYAQKLLDDESATGTNFNEDASGFVEYIEKLN